MNKMNIFFNTTVCSLEKVLLEVEKNLFKLFLSLRSLICIYIIQFIITKNMHTGNIV